MGVRGMGAGRQPLQWRREAPNDVDPPDSHMDAACSCKASPNDGCRRTLQVPAIDTKVPRRHRNAQPSRPPTAWALILYEFSVSLPGRHGKGS